MSFLPVCMYIIVILFYPYLCFLPLKLICKCCMIIFGLLVFVAYYVWLFLPHLTVISLN